MRGQRVRELVAEAREVAEELAGRPEQRGQGEEEQHRGETQSAHDQERERHAPPDAVGLQPAEDRGEGAGEHQRSGDRDQHRHQTAQEPDRGDHPDGEEEAARGDLHPQEARLVGRRRSGLGHRRGVRPTGRAEQPRPVRNVDQAARAPARASRPRRPNSAPPSAQLPSSSTSLGRGSPPDRHRGAGIDVLASRGQGSDRLFRPGPGSVRHGPASQFAGARRASRRRGRSGSGLRARPDGGRASPRRGGRGRAP